MTTMMMSDRGKLATYVRTVTLYGFAGLGVCTLIGLGLVGCMRRTMYVTDRIGSVASPDGRLHVVGEVTRGGLGTVWTTRLYLEDSSGDRMLIYSNRDSDFVPRIRWTASERVTVVIGCGRADHLANPAAWARGTSPIERVRVRWSHDAALCSRIPLADE